MKSAICIPKKMAIIDAKKHNKYPNYDEDAINMMSI